MQIIAAFFERQQDRDSVNQKALITKKVRNATLKRFYESKIAALSDHSLSPHLLRLLCQGAPMAKVNLDTPYGRRAYAKKCRSYYLSRLQEIEASEKKGWFGLFS